MKETLVPIIGLMVVFMGIVVIIIASGFGADINQTLYNQGIQNVTTDAANTTRIFTNSSNASLNGQLLDFSSVTVYNTTSLVLVEAANYTLGRNPPTIVWNNASTTCAGGCYNGTNVTISYNYLNTTIDDSDAAIRNGSDALATGSASVDTVVIAAVMAALMFMLFIVVMYVKGKQ